jgi:hypothetical protein
MRVLGQAALFVADLGLALTATFKHEDVLRLSRLRRNLPARSHTEVIRMALELLESST